MVPREDEELLDQDEEVQGADDENAAGESAEARARAMGWVPEEEWDEDRAERAGRRKPTKFLTPEEFISRVESEVPVLRERNRHLTTEVQGLTKKINEMLDVFSEDKRMQREALARAREDERKKWEAKMDQSAAEADVDGYQEAKAKVAEFSSDPEKPAEQKPDGRNPEIENWIAGTPWWNKDGVMTAFMTEEFGRVQANHPGISISDALAAAEKETRNKFPERFGERPRQPARQPLNPTGERPAATDVERRFRSLPAEDQAAYEKQRKMFEGRGVKFTKKEFVADYFGEA